MTNSLIKNLLSGFGGKGKNKAAIEEIVVDISRVIPGYAAAEVETVLAEPAAPKTAPAEHTNDTQNAANMAPEDTAEYAVDELSGKHDEWVQNDLARLQHAWSTARTEDFSEVSMAAFVLASHDLKGMATTYGHPAISRLATSLSSLLENSDTTAQAALINLHVEACRAAYLEASAGNGTNAIANSVCAALEAQVRRTVGG